MIDWNQIRDYFPAAKRLVYLNPAGGSPMPFQAANEGKRFYDEMLYGGDIYWDEWLERVEQTRQKLASFLNADIEEIAFAQNTSHAMNQVAVMLKGKGEVITTADEFPSTTFPWLHQGYQVQFVKPVNGYYPIDEFQKSITNDTKILVCSHVQYNTGYRQDLSELSEFCKKNNLILVLNTTQGMGSMPIDFKKYDIDFIVFTALKWTLSGYGIGGLIINKKWLSQISLPFAGWRSVKRPELMDNQKLDLKQNASVTEVGSAHFPNIFALGGALDLLGSIGQNAIFERIIELNSYLEKKLNDLKLTVVSILDRKHRSGITVVKMDNPKEIAAKLYKQNIYVSARSAGLRISVHIFTNFDDIDKLAEGLAKL